MSLNIQTSTGLLEISTKVTKEKITEALGYEPADKEVETTVDTHTKDTDIHITSDERILWNKDVEDLDAHTTDKTVHVTSAEKETWNNKSDFSGAYADLIDAPNITENDSDSMVIADRNGNIIMQVDADGVSTTNVNTKTVKLNGKDLGERLDELEANMVSNIVEDESGKVEFTDEAGNVIARIGVDGFETTAVTAKSAIIGGVDITAKLDEHKERIDSATNHITNEVVHITADERTLWNNKSDFSGDYNDLTNAPDIKEDNSGEVVYADESGNVIVRIGEAGLETTQVIADTVVVSGTNVGTKLSGLDSTLSSHTGDSDIHITDEERTAWDAKSDFSGNYADLVDAPNINEDESGELVVADRAGNIIFRSDNNGVETTTLTAKSVVVNGIDVEEKLNNIKETFYINVGTDGVADKTGKEFNEAFINGNILVLRQSIEMSNGNLAITSHREYEYVGCNFSDASTGDVADIDFNFSCVSEGVIYNCKVEGVTSSNEEVVTCTFSSINIEETINDKTSQFEEFVITVTDGIADKTNSEVLAWLFGGDPFHLTVLEDLGTEESGTGISYSVNRIYKCVDWKISEANNFTFNLSTTVNSTIYECEVVCDVRSEVGDDPVSITFTATDLEATLDNKVDKEDGKGLSTNDFTTEEKEKLENIKETFYIHIDENNVCDKTYKEISSNIDIGAGVTAIVEQKVKASYNSTTYVPRRYEFVRVASTSSGDWAYKFYCIENGVIYECIIMSMGGNVDELALPAFSSMNLASLELITVDDIDTICGVTT